VTTPASGYRGDAAGGRQTGVFRHCGSSHEQDDSVRSRALGWSVSVTEFSAVWAYTPTMQAEVSNERSADMQAITKALGAGALGALTTTLLHEVKF